jgi:HEAT repeat protein
MVTTLNGYMRCKGTVTLAICQWLLAISAHALLLSLLVAASPAGAAAAVAEPASVAKERALISLLQSKAPPAEKALACKQLAIYGTKDAVPALAPLLSDPHLASWARIALEVIPDPAADAALRRAMGKLQGNLLVGVINSIGVRRDAAAVSGLVKKLKASDPEVASAAAVALGRIGGTDASKALTKALATAREALCSAMAEGAVLCAERFAAQGKQAEAVKLYDTVRAANVPRQRQLEAIRGAILARQSAGLPLLLEQLRSPDKALFGIGLRTARELPGGVVTEALAAEMRQCNAERQPFLLLALADRRDPAVMPAVWEAAASGSTKLRLTAITVLERQGTLTSMPLLLKVAAGPDPEIAQAALSAIIRLPGDGVDTDIVRRISSYKGKVRAVLLAVAGQRHIDMALPIAFNSLRDPDPAMRSAAVQTVGILGTDAHAADLVGLLQESQSANEREQVQTALLAIIGRTGTRSVPALLPLAHNNDSAMRLSAMHLLASAGGPDALAQVQAAVQDKDEAVQDEAVRTLSTWPNNWPEDGSVAQPLLALAKADAKPSHQVLALRGYLQCLQSNKQLKDEEKVSQVSDVLPLLKRPEEKRLAIAALGALPTPAALDLLMRFAEDATVADDASAAIVKLADPLPPSIPREKGQQALQVVAEKCPSDATKNKARELLKAAP